MSGFGCRKSSYSLARIAAGVAALAAAAHASLLHAEWTLDAEAGLSYERNVTRADRPEDVRGDAFAGARAGASWRTHAFTDDVLQLDASVRGVEYARFHRLSMAALDLGASYRHKFGVGLAAPFVAVSGQASAEDYLEDTRDSTRLVLVVEAGRRFDERTDASILLEYDRRLPRHDDELVPGISGAVFDIVGKSATLRIGHAPTDRVALEASYQFRRGDVVSTTRPNLPIFVASEAVGETAAFGDGFYDYRLRGTTQSVAVLASIALGSHASINLGYDYAYTHAAQGLRYQDGIVSLTLLHRL